MGGWGFFVCVFNKFFVQACQKYWMGERLPSKTATDETILGINKINKNWVNPCVGLNKMLMQVFCFFGSWVFFPPLEFHCHFLSFSGKPADRDLSLCWGQQYGKQLRTSPQLKVPFLEALVGQHLWLVMPSAAYGGAETRCADFHTSYWARSFSLRQGWAVLRPPIHTLICLPVTSDGLFNPPSGLPCLQTSG